MAKFVHNNVKNFANTIIEESILKNFKVLVYSNHKIIKNTKMTQKLYYEDGFLITKSQNRKKL